MPERPTFSDNSREEPIELAVGAGGGCLECFSHLSSSPWETVRYRLKYCMKWQLNQQTNVSWECMTYAYVCIHTELWSVPRAKICICFTCKSIIQLVLHVTYISTNFIFNQF